MRWVRRLLRLMGKGDAKVAAVFAFDPFSCHRAVAHVAAGAPGIPIWLFTTVAPPAETAGLCERVAIGRHPAALLMGAQGSLWSRWVVLAVAPWTGAGGPWLLKLAPFLTPPFRVLLLNEHGDFFPGTPARVLGHLGRRGYDRVHPVCSRLFDLRDGYWRLFTYHIWRSGPVRRVTDEVAAFLLLAAATGLKLTGHPHRWMFRQLHGAESLAVEEAAAGASGGVARFCQRGRVWNGAALEAFARSSQARWILWVEGEDVPVDLESLLPVLEIPRIFAASRQSHFRAWKPSLLPAAPFRTLQPGEASAVLAPIANAVLVDRRKLLALGVPRGSLAMAAWMVLFWKAAAAGWRSCSVGRRKASTLREQPDFPAQETALFLNVLRHKELRRLGPREPDLVRGSIAFSPALQQNCRPLGKQPKVLLVSPFLPYPLSHGGAVRIYNLCRALFGRVDFILAAMRESHEAVDYAKLHEVFCQVWVVDQDERPSGDASLPEQVRQYQSRSMRALIAELARRWKPDVLQIEYTHMAAFRQAAPEIPAVLVEHDLTFSLYRQLADKNPASRAAQREYQRWLAFEQRWLRDFDAVWTVSEQDRQEAIAAGERDPSRTLAIPNGVDIDRFQPCAESSGPPEILYVGSFRHLPNFLGFEKLRSEIMPRLWQRFPELRLRVVAGPEHQRYGKQFARTDAGGPLDKRIEVHGFVEDLRPLYAGASVVVVPLEVSAGTNIKVLEAMASGRPVVSTPVGCTGLGLTDGLDILIREDVAGFAEAVGDLVADAEGRRALAAAARRTVENRFGWQAIGEIAWKGYLALSNPVPTTVFPPDLRSKL